MSKSSFPSCELRSSRRAGSMFERVTAGLWIGIQFVLILSSQLPAARRRWAARECMREQYVVWGGVKKCALCGVVCGVLHGAVCCVCARSGVCLWCVLRGEAFCVCCVLCGACRVV